MLERARSRIARASARLLALLLSFALSLLGCPPRGSMLPPSSGVAEFQEPALLPVPGGRVNLAGGNLIVERADLSIDTRLGTQTVGAVYNSASGSWLWSFDLTYDGASFLDRSGRRHDVSRIPFGAAIPGTVWVVVDEDSIKTKGGLVHDFRPDGTLASIHWSSAPDPSLRTEVEAIGGRPRVTAIRQCTAVDACADVFSIRYDGTGRVTSIVDRAGRLAEFAYDRAGRLASARDGLDTEMSWPGFRYAYSGTRLTALTSSEGERIEYAYAGARVVRVRAVGEGDPEHRFFYGGKLRGTGVYFTRVWDPLGRELRVHYDAEGRLLRRSHPSLGETWSYGWQGFRMTSRVTPDGVSTAWTHRGDDVATEITAGGNVVRYRYAPEAENRGDPFARPILRIDDRLGLVEARSFDARGRPASVTNGAGETTAFEYGPLGELTAVTHPSGVRVTLSGYGAHGHPTQKAVGDIVQRAEYDAVGNLLRGFRESPGLPTAWGGVASRAFDTDRNLRSLSLSDWSFEAALSTQTLVLEHRSDGRAVRMARPYGGDVEFRYDALGRLVERRERADGAWASTRFEYDAAGRTTAVELPNGTRRELAYDDAGRVVRRAALRDGAVEATLDVTRENGRIVSIRDSSYGAPEAFAYDGAGRLVRTSFPGGESLEVRYDVRSRPVTRTYRTADGAVLRRFDLRYDGANREVGVSENGSTLIERGYDGGRVRTVHYGNGLVRSFAYDPDTGGLVRTVTVDGAGRTLERTTLTQTQCYSAHRCLVARTDTEGGVAASSTERYGLFPTDALGDPSGAGVRVGAWDDASGFVRFYAYDELSNLTGAETDAETHVFNRERNRLAEIRDAADGVAIDYTYDEAGFATSRAGVPLAWTASGRIAAIGDEAAFAWDLLGRPVSRSVDGVETRWQFGGAAEADADGTPLAIDLGEVRVALPSGEHRYRHLDFRNNVKFVSDDAASVGTHYRYSAYALEEVIGTSDDGRRFAGGWHVGDLVVLGLRVYDPVAARFLSPDPIHQLLNQYAYTLGNPVWYWDPAGSQALELIMAGTGLGLMGSGLVGAKVAGTFAVGWGLVGVGTVFIAIGIGLAISGNFDAAAVGADAGGSAGSSATGSPSGGNGGASPKPNGGGDAPGAGVSGCAPTALVAAPDLSGALALLIPLQILLGIAVLRRRRRGANGASRS